MAEDIIKRALLALINLDAKALVSCYADNFSYLDTATNETITDIAQLTAYYNRLFSVPDTKFTGGDYFISGQRAAGEWSWQGTSLKSGKPFSIRGASLFKIEKDKIEEELIFYDPRKAYQ